MRVREMTWRDIETLTVLEEALFGPAAWSSATWWAELAERPRREYLVAEQDGRLVGYAGLDHGGRVADVMTVAVVPERRRSGLGDQLLGELLRRAGERGAEAVLLEVRADNAAALRLYERGGFVQVSVRRRYYQPGDVDAYVLRRHLGSGLKRGSRER